MRDLTLNEKINIKADLARFGVKATNLVRLNIRSAMFYGNLCHRRPGAYFIRLNRTKEDLSRMRKRLAS
jgi:hypothetical protein